jgi:hypothetical protein
MRFRYSPYYVEPPKAKREIEKFSDRIIQQTVKPKVYNLLKDFGDAFPYELLKRARKKVTGTHTGNCTGCACTTQVLTW